MKAAYERILVAVDDSTEGKTHSRKQVKLLKQIIMPGSLLRTWWMKQPMPECRRFPSISLKKRRNGGRSCSGPGKRYEGCRPHKY